MAAGETATPLAGVKQPSLDRLLALPRSDLGVLSWLLPLALLHGLLYLAFVPPWQHYDEPAHFLYAAEIAAGELLEPGVGSAAISREIADSMYRFRFYPEGVQPDVLGSAGVGLGENQRVHPPLYYLLASLPIRALRFLSVEQQLYAARGLSLLLYLLTVLAAWRIAVVMFPTDRLLQATLSLLVTLAPAFTDLMTAVNSDVLAHMSVTICLLGCVLLIRDGFRPVPLALALLGLLVALMAKRTAVGVSIPLVLALIWSVHRRPISWRLSLGLLFAVGLLGGLLSLRVTTLSEPEPHLVLTARDWLAELDRVYLRLNIEAWISSLTDPSRIGGRYLVLATVAFTGFWARYGWGNVAPWPVWDMALAGFVLAAVVGLCYGFMRHAVQLPLWQRRALLLMFLATSMAWLSLVARLHPLPPIEQPIYVPRGRYMFWAIVPHVWLFVLGLRWLISERWRQSATLGLVALFACFSWSAGFWTIVNANYR